MAVIKCKMCGGDLDLIGGQSVAECEYCGSRQTVPADDNEKKLTLFARANRLRAACEFDKAAGIYESIVADFPEEAEAYWGLVLCKYGIEYVDDPATGKKIPTCHRSSFDSILEDSDFEQALENADVMARKVYREEAKQIEEIRKGIIAVSANEAPYDIFICYKETDANGDRTLDSVLAQDIYDALTDKGYRVFFSRITLEDKLGVEYEPYIFAALNSAKIMLAIGTDYEHFNAVWVKNEWSRFLKLMAKDKDKHLIPCFKGIDAYDMPKEFARLQAQDLGKVGAMQDLLRGIEKILPKTKPVTVVQEKIIVQGGSSGGNGGPDTASLLKRTFMFLEDSDWKSANEYCEKVLDIDPENAHAYVGKLMAELHVQRQEQMKDQRKPFDTRNSYMKAIRFADSVLKAELEGYLAHIYKRLQNAEAEAIYQNALSAMQNKEYEEAAKLFDSISGYEDADARRQICVDKYQQLLEELKGKREEAALLSRRIHTNSNFSVGIKEDGTLINTDPYAKALGSRWKNLIAVTSVCNEDIFALRTDGTVISNELDTDEDLDQMYFVDDWRNIIAISGGSQHLLGLKKDGTVMATGVNDHGECDVSLWKDIVEISAGSCVSVGLKKNGTVIVTGFAEGLEEIENWTDIVSISCGSDHVLGLKENGTVLAAGENKYGQCNVSAWKNIVAINAGEDHSLGLTKDHTVFATHFIKTGVLGDISDLGQCNVGTWKKIVAISAGDAVSLGITADGYAVATGCVENCSCYVSDWKLFGSFASDSEKTIYQSAQKRVQRLKELTLTRYEISEKIQDTVQERDALTGFFAGKRRKELEKQREALYAQDDGVLTEIRALMEEDERQQAELLQQQQ